MHNMFRNYRGALKKIHNDGYSSCHILESTNYLKL